MRKFSAAARICRPKRVAFRNQVSPHEQDGADEDGDELQALQPDAGDLDLAAERRQEVDALRPRADEEDQRLLQEEADREGRDEQRRRIGAAERPEGDALGRKREQHGAETAPPTACSGSGMAEQREERVAGRP